MEPAFEVRTLTIGLDTGSATGKFLASATGAIQQILVPAQEKGEFCNDEY